MNNVGFVLIILGLVFLFYAVICRNKISVYNKSYKFRIVNEKKFLKLQLIFSI